MEALRASYADSSSGNSDSDSDSKRIPKSNETQPSLPALPPPPISILNPPNFIGTFDYLQSSHSSRVRTFPHVEGKLRLTCIHSSYQGLHFLSQLMNRNDNYGGTQNSVRIPSESKKELIQFLRKVTSIVPGLHVVDADIPLNMLLKDDQTPIQIALGKEFHISLGRTVPLRVHQIDSVVTMLRQKLQLQKRYWIDFSKWEVFVNDDQTRSFLSLEIIKGGLTEIKKQIQAVNEVYKLHNLPEFYKDPRPHISIAWELGDVRDLLKRVLEEEMKKYTDGGSSKRHMFTCKFGGIECKIGNKTYKICKFQEEQ